MGHVPQRTCIACGTKAPRDRLLRIVLAGGVPMWDERRRMPGRGAYVCARPDCIDVATRNLRGCLSRAFRRGFSRQELDSFRTPGGKVYLPGSNLQT